MRFSSNFPNRTYCDVLEEMRQIIKTLNNHNTGIVGPVISSLIEACQVYGNRMEAGLSDKADIHSWQVERAKLRKEIGALREEKLALGGVLDD